MMPAPVQLGFGIGWRPEIALWIARRQDLGFVEVVAENLNPSAPLPKPIEQLLARGVAVLPHGISLSLGGAEPPDPARLEDLGSLARRLNAPLVSEHLSFVRAGGIEAGHLLPLARTREMLDVVVENLGAAKAALPVPLAVENIATLVDWPQCELSEAEFLAEVLERADVLWLLDVSNLYANARNHGWDPCEMLDRAPLERIVYAHVGGGIERNGFYHDTHGHRVPDGVLDLLAEISARVALPGVLLERDDFFPSDKELNREMDAIADAVDRGAGHRKHCHAG